MRTLSLVLLVARVLAAADLDNNTVTITATRTIKAQPDQVRVVVQVAVPQDTGLDDVLAKLKGTGITASDLQYANGQQILFPDQRSNQNVQWTFVTTTSLASLKSMRTNLAQLQANLGANALTFSVAGTQVSTDAQDCPLSALVSDARKQADALAAAAGMRTGAIVSVSNGPAVIPIAVYDLLGVPVPSGISRVGSFSSAIITSPQASCSLTVQFKLL
jgi:hypothetical protein